MFSRRTIAAAAMLTTMLLTGCQSAAIDGMETSAFAAGSADPSARDVEAGKRQFRAANYGLAEKHFRKAVEVRAANPEAWIGLAAAYDQLGRFDFADRAYEQGLKLVGRRPEILNNMGYSHYLRGDHDKARAFLMEARAAMADPAVVDANIALLH